MSVTYMELKNFEELVRKRTQLQQYVSAIGLADMAVYHYIKDGGLFSKKQERSIFYFFQGLNTNPQNLSIFLRDQHQKQAKTSSKQKIVKGQFIIYDIFKKVDCVIEINIPGNFQIYKIHNNKKQLISNSEMEMMYVSSVLRSVYNKNLAWGRSYCLFKSKNMLKEFLEFLEIFIRVIEQVDFYISDDFQNASSIKGSHAAALLFQFVTDKHIIHHTVEYLEMYIKKKKGYANITPKIAILLAELYNKQEKYAKSLSIIGGLLEKYTNDPFLLYYQAKYMYSLLTIHEALALTNSIIQFNQYQVWILASQIHIELKNYSDALACLNHASRGSGKVSKNYPKRNIEQVYAEFQKIGKKKITSSGDEISNRPKLISISQNPLPLAGLVQEKLRCMIQSEFWKLNEAQKHIFDLLRRIKSRIQPKKFHQLLENTFEENLKQFAPVVFKKGMTDSMFIELKPNNQESMIKNEGGRIQEQEDLPHFLQDQSVQVQTQEIIKNNRNLSIIPQIQSVIQNSQFEQKQKQSHSHKTIHIKKQMTDSFYKILKILLNENQYEKAEYEANYPKILPIYNKLRVVSKYNNFYTVKMFDTMVKTSNYKSIVVLIAETLDLLEQTGVKKIEILPYWIQKYVYAIIQEKGLKFLNQLLQKLNFYDEALLDTIQMSKSWKIKGCTF